MTETLVDAMVQTFRHGGANPPGSTFLSARIGPSPDPCFGGTGALSSRTDRAFARSVLWQDPRMRGWRYVFERSGADGVCGAHDAWWCR
jgi:hypothetical protein